MTIKQIAERYGVSETTARRMVDKLPHTILVVKVDQYSPARKVLDYKERDVVALFKHCKPQSKPAKVKAEKAKPAKGKAEKATKAPVASMIRTYSAGVWAGEIDEGTRSADGKRATVRNARRIWYWAGAASLSELATRGTSKPKECKFPVAVASVELTEIIEVIPMTPGAIASIAAVPVWTA